MSEAKITVQVNWLDNCPNCGNENAAVTGYRITPNLLKTGNEVKCMKCGHIGEIDADGENAWVEWDEVPGDAV